KSGQRNPPPSFILPEISWGSGADSPHHRRRACHPARRTAHHRGMDGTDRDRIAAGMRAGLPVALGYLPAAFAFGAAASAIGLSAPEVGAMSAIVFSGANQAFLLAAIPAGMPVVLMVALTAAASLRHLLYGL